MQSDLDDNYNTNLVLLNMMTSMAYRNVITNSGLTDGQLVRMSKETTYSYAQLNEIFPHEIRIQPSKEG